MPDVEELYAFKKCVRKFSRVKMRAVTYYHKDLHREENSNAGYLLKNLSILKPFLPNLF